MFGMIVSATLIVGGLSFMAGLNYGLHIKEDKREE